MERLADYGRDLGVAFQIADDVLDLSGDACVAGKTLGTDLEQQKLTLPLIRALAELPAEEAERLRTAFRRGAVPEIADVLSSAGTIEAVEAEDATDRGIGETGTRSAARKPLSSGIG